jgi:hypothetical protein
MLGEILVQVGSVNGCWEEAEVNGEDLCFGDGAGVMLFGRVEN